MKRKDALRSIAEGLGDTEPVISTVGIISREFYEIADSGREFYMAGSMGMASSIGLGVAVSNPDAHVVIIDGDGSLLLNFGATATLGHHSLSNMTHIVVDNNAYASCSREPTMSDTVSFPEVADDVGYAEIAEPTLEDELTAGVESRPTDGPKFIHVKIETGGQRHPARILDLPHFKERFENHLSSM